MRTTKALLAVAALVETSLAQTYIHPSECSSSINDLNIAAPTLPAVLQSAYGAFHSQEPNAEILLSDPGAYVKEVCGVVSKLPKEVLGDFGDWGSALLHFASTRISSYDAIITDCITTGAAAASITNYLHSIVSQPDKLCQPTSTPNGGNTTPTITPYPTSTGNNSTITSTGVPSTLVPTAAAAKPTGVLVGAAAIGGLLGAVALL